MAIKPAPIVPLDTVAGISVAEREALTEIARDIGGALQRIERAAKRWMDLSEATRRKVVEATPAGFRDFWGRLERVGKGELHPQLAMASTWGARTLAKLPMEEQEHYLTHLIPVAIEDHGRQDDQFMAADAMSNDIRRQVFETQGPAVRVRTLDEQRAWLVEQRRKEAAKREREANQPTRLERAGWVLENGRIYLKPEKVEKGLTRADVARMLRDFSL